MAGDSNWTIEQVWEELSSRFGELRVAPFRGGGASAESSFDQARDELRAEVAELSGSTGNINRADAKAQLVFAHVVLAILDGVRRGRRAWRPMPAMRENRAAEETALLLWAADHGGYDIRESHVQEREPGTAI